MQFTIRVAEHPQPRVCVAFEGARMF